MSSESSVNLYGYVGVLSVFIRSVKMCLWWGAVDFACLTLSGEAGQASCGQAGRRVRGLCQSWEEEGLVPSLSGTELRCCCGLGVRGGLLRIR